VRGVWRAVCSVCVMRDDGKKGVKKKERKESKRGDEGEKMHATREIEWSNETTNGQKKK
jgi:hypothetical protein